MLFFFFFFLFFFFFFCFVFFFLFTHVKIFCTGKKDGPKKSNNKSLVVVPPLFEGKRWCRLCEVTEGREEREAFNQKKCIKRYEEGVVFPPHIHTLVCS